MNTLLGILSLAQNLSEDSLEKVIDFVIVQISETNPKLTLELVNNGVITTIDNKLDFDKCRLYYYLEEQKALERKQQEIDNMYSLRPFREAMASVFH